jgi:hypothetical protein
MKRAIQAGVLVITAILCSSALIAQERPAAANSSSVTVVGCMQRTEQSGTLGTTIPERAATPENAGVLANSGEPGRGFVLAGAMPAAPDGAKPATAAAEQPKRYILVGDSVDLAKHEGQRVRVNGTIVPSTKPEDRTVGTSGSTQIKSETQRLRVTSVEIVDAQCAAAR